MSQPDPSSKKLQQEQELHAINQPLLGNNERKCPAPDDEQLKSIDSETRILINKPCACRADQGGAYLAWKDITLNVPIAGGKTKTVLDSVSGFVRPGEVLYIMGPSGSGKSTLLDSLADRVLLPVQGQVTVDGIPRHRTAFRHIMKYVQQSDVLYESLTTKETLQMAASFYHTDPTVKAERVEKVLEMLGLVKQADTKIGGIFFRGLSGGQQRRVSIGMELLASPRLLFLDEPTSGLDSASSFYLMQAIRDIAHNLCTTIVCTIHQPSESVFKMSDRLLLLSAGKVAYFGPTPDAVKHFESLGVSLPPMTSASEWMLDLINGDFQKPEDVKRMVSAFAESPAMQAVSHLMQSHSSSVQRFQKLADIDRPLLKGELSAPTSTLSQMNTLAWVFFLNMIRNPATVWLRMAMYAALSIMIGTVWVGQGGKADSIQDVVNVLFFIAAFMVFMSISVLPVYLQERAIFTRQRANGCYSVTSYMLAHFVVELPFVALLAVVAASICYWPVGLTADAGRFFFFVLNLFLSFMVAESIMILVAAIVPAFIVGIAMGSFVFGTFMVVQGFFIKLTKIGWWWRWLHYLALHSYSFSSFMKNEFDTRSWNIQECSKAGFCASNGREVLDVYDLANADIWVNSAVLVGMIVVYRVLAASWMWKFHTGKK